MAGTAVIAAVAFHGATEESFIERQISLAEERITNIIKNDLATETLEGANREVNGGMKVAKVGGEYFNHPEKVERG
jgi:hypothetical protein